MGWDISYHPISEQEIKEWYFDVLENPNLVEVLASKYNLDDLYKEKFSETIKTGLATKPEDVFDENHGYFIAVVQGFFRDYFYVRGAALSFSKNPILKGYFKTWEHILSAEKLTKHVNNQIIQNYCSGVFVPKDQVVKLLDDYHNLPAIKQELDKLFSHGTIKILLKALDFAKQNELGLLEATEVIEPNPLDLNSSTCYSNLFNCDPEGAMLYQKTAMGQIAEIEKSKNLTAGTISSNAEYRTSHVNSGMETKTKPWWKFW